MLFHLEWEGEELRNHQVLIVSPAIIDNDQCSFVKLSNNLSFVRRGSPDPVIGKYVQNSLEMGIPPPKWLCKAPLS